MQEDERSFLSKIPDNVKISFFRWWFFGAIYYLIAIGTDLGFSDSPIDLIFFLGLGIGIGNIFVFNPLVYSMFDIERKGKIVNKKYYERTILEGSFIKLMEVFKCLICSICVYLIYQGINMALISLLNKSQDDIVLAGEPILFGIFYLIVYLLFTKIAVEITELFRKKNGEQ